MTTPARQPVPLRRRAAILLLLAAALPAAAQSVSPAATGPVLGSVVLRITPDRDTMFLQDLADFADHHQLAITGDPAGLTANGRPVFLVWLTRPDGAKLLVTDGSAPERMQAFFYGAADGSNTDAVADLMRAYLRKMATHPAFVEPPAGAAP